jgi:hypothetical protein
MGWGVDEMPKILNQRSGGQVTAILGSLIIAISPIEVLASEQAGVTAAVEGNVQLTESETDAERGMGIGDAFSGGEDVFLGDTVESAASSGMQLMLLDETTFTLGPESDLTIDQFVYDPATGAGELSAEATKGIFRYVSGSVTDNDADATEIDLGSGTMGVRGTMALVAFGEKEGTLVVNLGPGPKKEQSKDKIGVIDVLGSKDRSRLSGSGTSAFLRPDGSVSDPFQISPRRLALLISRLDQGASQGGRIHTFGGRSLRGGSATPRQSSHEGFGDRSFIETDYSPDDFVDFYLDAIQDMIDDDVFEEYYEEYDEYFDEGGCPC